MEQETGFLVLLATAYPLIMPLLRGIYLKMNTWSSGGDLDGWNISKRAYDTYINAGLGEGSAKFSSGYYKEENAPIKAKAVPRLFKQIETLYLLLGDNKISLRL